VIAQPQLDATANLLHQSATTRIDRIVQVKDDEPESRFHRDQLYNDKALPTTKMPRTRSARGIGQSGHHSELAISANLAKVANEH
jgi:hypothetical protein